MHVTFQRNRTGQQDFDIVAFGIRVAGVSIGPISGTVLAGSGDTIQFAEHLRPRLPLAHWEVGPTEIGPHDSVDIAYTVTNAAQSPEGHPTSQDVGAIAFGTWTAAVAVAGVATGGAAAIAAAVVAALGAIGGIIVSIFGKNPPNCNGLVGADKISLNGSDLLERASESENTFSITSKSGNADIPSDCGHPSEITVTISVTRFPFYSLRQFFDEKSVGPAFRGIRVTAQASFPKLFTGETTSVRNIIESWELL
jgi:hypothetical protein